MRAHGFTLLELLIGVTILGALWAAAWSPGGLLSAPGRPGHEALRVRQATELLVQARHEALLEPLEVGAAALPSRFAGITLRREVASAGPGLLRITLRARWREGRQERALQIITAKAQP